MVGSTTLPTGVPAHVRGDQYMWALISGHGAINIIYLNNSHHKGSQAGHKQCSERSSDQGHELRPVRQTIRASKAGPHETWHGFPTDISQRASLKPTRLLAITGLCNQQAGEREYYWPLKACSRSPFACYRAGCYQRWRGRLHRMRSRRELEEGKPLLHLLSFSLSLLRFCRQQSRRGQSGWHLTVIWAHSTAKNIRRTKWWFALQDCSLDLSYLTNFILASSVSREECWSEDLYHWFWFFLSENNHKLLGFDGLCFSWSRKLSCFPWRRCHRRTCKNWFLKFIK